MVLDLKLPQTTFERFGEHFRYWDFEKGTSKWPILLQNMNAASAIVSVTLPASLTLCLSINYFTEKEAHLSPALGILTNSAALLLSFLLSGPSHLFKSFSSLQAYFIMLLVGRFGVSIVPWVTFSLGWLTLVATFLKFQNLIYLIPTSLCVALKNAIGIHYF